MSGRRAREAAMGRHTRPGLLTISDARAIHSVLWAAAGLIGLFILAARAGGLTGVAVIAVFGALAMLGHQAGADD